MADLMTNTVASAREDASPPSSLVAILARDGSVESPATSMARRDVEGTSPSTFAYQISSEELLQYREKYAQLRETWRVAQAIWEDTVMENSMVDTGFQEQSVELDSSVISRKQSSGKFHRNYHSSTPPIFRRQDFPSLAEFVSIRRRKKGHGPPFDKDGRNFSFAVKDENFPFSEVEEDALTLKFAPIKLCWLKRSSSLNNLGRGVA
jgi:hypothetical protein